MKKKRRMALSCSKKILSALLKGITSKHDGNFYCLNSLHSFSTEKKLKYHEKVCKNRLLQICNAIPKG